MFEKIFGNKKVDINLVVGINQVDNLGPWNEKINLPTPETQKEIESSTYEGNSSLVHVVLNGKKEVVSININIEEDLSSLDKEMLEDMIMLAFNDACRKAEADKEVKLNRVLEEKVLGNQHFFLNCL